MTSNIGTAEGSKSLGFGGGEAEKLDYSGYLSQFFRPEFINRLDEVITFNRLSAATLSDILNLQLTELHERLDEQHMTLVLADDARELILRVSHDPMHGARPLRRAVERLVTRPLSARIVEDAFAPGDTIVVHAAGADRLAFVVEPPAVNQGEAEETPTQAKTDG
jgi:ATP-dependent Clp protease ATP-binding subunit ClpA